MTKRDAIQHEAVSRWREETRRLDGNLYKGRLEIGTGVGKSKIACDILREISSSGETVLILTPSTELRDFGWPEQIQKYYPDNRLNIHYECYQTARLVQNRAVKIIIADEFDFALTEEYSKVFAQTQYRDLIALTAYVPSEKVAMADAIAPLCFTYTTQQAQADGILNKTKFYTVNFDLSQAKTIEVKYKKNGRAASFMQSENSAYAYQQEQFAKSIIAKSRAEKAYNTAALLEQLTDEVETNKQKAEWQIRRSSGKRKEMLHSLTSSVKVVKALLESVHSGEEELGADDKSRCLIFSKLTTQAERISEDTYHAKNKSLKISWNAGPDADDLEHVTKLQALSMGIIRQLGVCEAVNRGINLDSVNWIIQESYIGSDVDFQQKHGRGTRLDALDCLHYFILVPHYWERVSTTEGNRTIWNWVRKPTQAATWMQNMSAEFDMSSMETIEVLYDSSTDTYKLPPPYDRLRLRS